MYILNSHINHESTKPVISSSDKGLLQVLCNNLNNIGISTDDLIGSDENSETKSCAVKSIFMAVDFDIDEKLISQCIWADEFFIESVAQIEIVNGHFKSIVDTDESSMPDIIEHETDNSYQVENDNALARMELSETDAQTSFVLVDKTKNEIVSLESDGAIYDTLSAYDAVVNYDRP